MNGDQPSLILPFLAPLYQTLAPWTEALLRLVAGAAMVPHGLRAIFGMFPGSGRVSSFAETKKMLDSRGFRPGAFWAYVLAATQFVAGPALAIGLLTRPAALVCCVCLVAIAYDRNRTGGYFWNKQGFEYPMVWAVICLHFAIAGGGRISIDSLLLRAAF